MLFAVCLPAGGHGYLLFDSMQILQVIVLGIIQGIAEFLPISSSGHLVFVRKILGFTDEGLNFDIFLHLGTLLAIIIYFFKDWLKILKDLFNKKGIFLQILIATLPAAAAGIFLEKTVENLFRNVLWVAVFLIMCGGFFIFAEMVYKNKLARQQARNLEKITWREALFIGIIQIFALLPGISRSGSTISAGIILGLKREESARFSFLMAALIIAGAGAFGMIDSIKSNSLDNFLFESMIGFFTAAATGYLSIKFLMAFLKKYKLNVFAFYLMIIGTGLLIWEIL